MECDTLVVEAESGTCLIIIDPVASLFHGTRGRACLIASPLVDPPMRVQPGGGRAEGGPCRKFLTKEQQHDEGSDQQRQIHSSPDVRGQKRCHRGSSHGPAWFSEKEHRESSWAGNLR